MTDKEFKKLRRDELIEVILQLQQNEKNLMQEVATLQKKLAERRSKMENVGSIAEAAMVLNGVFESAQAAADQYVEQVRELNENASEHSRLILDNANRQAENILEDARLEASEMRQKAELSCAETRQKTEFDCAAMRRQAENDCNEMRGKITELLNAHDALRSLLDAKNN